ncbi:MAG: phosphoribosylanthranilate isomerase [Syntrophaceae bacterium]|nr:MAG: phosphoribosylanthranilate isomerase [Syntrophaceae bacterium]
MRRTIIQIYEVQKPKEAKALADLGVDHIGSVLPSSEQWKNATIRKTSQVIRQAGAKSGLIPLFKDPVKIFQAINYYQPDFVHFCEALSPFPGNRATVVREYDALLSLQLDVKDRFPEIEIMRSLSIPQAGMGQMDDIQKNILHFAELFAPFSDYFLIDTMLGGGEQPVSGYVGITGRVCDWKIAGAVINWSPIPVILAGGISDINVFEAVTTLKPAGIDSCTQTNAVDKSGQSVRFKKDMKKVKRLVEETRRADQFIEGEDFAAEPIHTKRI